MQAEAIAHVPLHALAALEGEKLRADFAIDEASAPHFATMLVLWQHYLQQVSRYTVAGATKGLGGQINQHMRAYYAWRFHAVRRNQAAKASGTATEQQQQVNRQERTFARDRAAIDAELKQARTALYHAEQRQELARILLEAAKSNQQRYGTPLDAETVQRHPLAQRETERRRIAYDRIRARQDTAADDSNLTQTVGKYDQMLFNDAKQIAQWLREDKSLKLRPHYSALMETYRDEFERGQGLRDAKVIEFFDDYVHDSLAGFDIDESWPSDPRIVYVGGDNKLRYASEGGAGRQGEPQAA